MRAIISTVRRRNKQASLAFHTTVHDFDRVAGDDASDGPGYSVPVRAGDRLILSSHRGCSACDGWPWEFGQAVVVTTADVDALVLMVRVRG